MSYSEGWGERSFGRYVCTAMLFVAALVLALPPAGTAGETAGPRKKVAILIPGNEKDGGFMEAAYRGYEKIRAELPVDVTYVSNISATSEAAALTAAMRGLAEQGPDMIIGHGGQCSGPVQSVSRDFPAIQFVVIQGAVSGPNLTSYAVNQEQSAWLAGALAGLMTKSGKVGHISGAWPKPGLRARAAFYHGLVYTRPQAGFYSTFTGNLDDAAINAVAADAQIGAGVDVIYTMLNGGREGVNERVRGSGGKVKSIGNVIDWTRVDPIFIGSAVADSSVAIYNAVRDLAHGTFTPGKVSVIDLREPQVVDLTMSSEVPASVRARMAALREAVLQGKITVDTTYEGKEFSPERKAFVDQTDKERNRKASPRG